MKDHKKKNQKDLRKNAKTLKYKFKEGKRLNALIETYLQTSTRSPTRKKFPSQI